jgi:hypothetical protein
MSRFPSPVRWEYSRIKSRCSRVNWIRSVKSDITPPWLRADARGSAAIKEIKLRVRSTNSRALSLYESVGFFREGVLRKHVRLTNGYLDDICMGLFVTEDDSCH